MTHRLNHEGRRKEIFLLGHAFHFKNKYFFTKVCDWHNFRVFNFSCFYNWLLFKRVVFNSEITQRQFILEENKKGNCYVLDF